jgi:HEAT repeat protein
MKRRIPLILAVLFGIAVLAITFEPTGVIRGRLTGESFFEGRPTSYWQTQLSGSPAEQATATDALKNRDAVPVLRALLAEPPTENGDVRWMAAEFLKGLGPNASAAAPELLAAARSNDERLPSVAAAALPKVGANAEDAVPVLTALLNSKHSVVAARALSEFKGQAKGALPELVKLMTDTSQTTEVRWNAARTIGKIGPDALSALPALIDMTRDAEPNVREHAAEAIGDIGPTATAGIPALVTVLNDDFVKVRRDAVRSLGWMGPAAKDAVLEMVKLLNDPEQLVRDAARKAVESVDASALPKEEPKPETPSAVQADSDAEKKP